MDNRFASTGALTKSAACAQKFVSDLAATQVEQAYGYGTPSVQTMFGEHHIGGWACKNIAPEVVWHASTPRAAAGPRGC